MPSLAQKYLACANNWMDLNRHHDWPHSHVSELCQKLYNIDENTIDTVDYEYLSRQNVSDEEMYEIGATALDCSIMLTIQRIDNESHLKSRYLH